MIRTSVRPATRTRSSATLLAGGTPVPVLALALAGAFGAAGSTGCTKSNEPSSGAPPSNAAPESDEASDSSALDRDETTPGDPGRDDATSNQVGGKASKGTMHRHNVFFAAASPTGEIVATSSASGEVIVWQTDPVIALHTLAPAAGTQRGKTRALAVSPDGKTVAIGVESRGTVERWNAESGQADASLDAYDGRVTALAYHPGGEILATAGADRKAGGSASQSPIGDAVPSLSPPVVRLWKNDAKSRELAGLQGTISALTFSPDGSAIAAGGDGSVRVWNTADGKEIAEHKIPGQVAAIAFVDDLLCAITSKLGTCFHKDANTEWSGVKAPTTAAFINASWVVNGTYEALQVRAFENADVVVSSIPDRVYSVVPVGRDIWAVFKDRAVVLRDGKPTGTEYPLLQK